MTLRSLCLVLPLALAAFRVVWGDVIVVNPSDEPRLYAVAYGEHATDGLPQPISARGLHRLKPGAELVLGRARALADSGGVAVAFYAVPPDSKTQPRHIRTEAVGAEYLRRAFGDTILRAD